ncbi:MAG: adenylate/guanylate cyclase domain-containing protein [Deltaproteobacteria bacterium]|nr:MAG: adenylate/guanylate cyclase domain-containing protein [Deltaproteobacteria bacterium]
MSAPYAYSDERYVGVARFVFLVSVGSHALLAVGALALGDALLVGYFAVVTALYAGLRQARSLKSVVWATWVAFAEVAAITGLLIAGYGAGLGVLTLLFFLATSLFFVPVRLDAKLGVLALLTAYGAGLVWAYGLLGDRGLGSVADGSALLVSVGFLAGLAYYYDRVVDLAEAGLRREHAKSERLLHNAMPAVIAERLKDEPEVLADEIPAATVLFADIVGFTPLAASTTPQELLVVLDDLFRRFDRCVEQAGMEKIKTIGDAYMAAAGVPVACDDHADRACRLGLAMIEALAAFNAERELPLGLRVGIHTGPVVAGVIGEKRFAYDLWGDTVNTAARMESHGEPGRVQVSEAVVAVAPGHRFEARGTVEIKGKGPMQTYFLSGSAS